MKIIYVGSDMQMYAIINVYCSVVSDQAGNTYWFLHFFQPLGLTKHPPTPLTTFSYCRKSASTVGALHFLYHIAIEVRKS